jgi:hypothetical protein
VTCLDTDWTYVMVRLPDLSRQNLYLYHGPVTWPVWTQTEPMSWPGYVTCLDTACTYSMVHLRDLSSHTACTYVMVRLRYLRPQDAQNYTRQALCWRRENLYLVLGAFRKIAKSDYELPHICPSVRMEPLDFHWTDFHEIWYWNIFRISVVTIQVSLKSERITQSLHEDVVHLWHHFAIFHLQTGMFKTNL